MNRNQNINKIIIDNAKLFKEDCDTYRALMLQIHEALCNETIMDNKEHFLDKMEKAMKLR